MNVNSVLYNIMVNLYTGTVIDSFDGEYAWLSNFHPCEIKMFGLMYPSVEHAYQASKLTSRQDRDRIREAPTAGKAKVWARNFKIRSDWEEKKYKFMKELVEYKFWMHDELKEKLLLTGDSEIIEGNWWGDTYWGVCNGKGENHLGRLLMRIRDDISSGKYVWVSGDHEITA